MGVTTQASRFLVHSLVVRITERPVLQHFTDTVLLDILQFEGAKCLYVRGACWVTFALPGSLCRDHLWCLRVHLVETGALVLSSPSPRHSE